MNKIYGLEKLSLVDFEGKICATVFTGGCNFRCPFCHNASLVLDVDSLEAYSEEEVFSYLEKRKNMLDAVCITGGEPTLNPDLEELVDKIKELGYLVKLDTNGSNPKMLKHLIDNKKIDYCAMDIKNSKELYFDTIGIINNTILNNVLESINILKNSNIDYEFRTTLVEELHTKESIEGIGKLISGCKNFYFQKFKDQGNCIKNGFHEVNIEKAKEYKEIIKKYVKKGELRGY